MVPEADPAGDPEDRLHDIERDIERHGCGHKQSLRPEINPSARI